MGLGKLDLGLEKVNMNYLAHFFQRIFVWLYDLFISK